MYKDKYLNQIVDAVKQGIVASKESDSKFWGDFQEWRKKKDARDEQMHDNLIKLGMTMESLLEAKKVQNGRLAKCEERIEPVENMANTVKGAIWIGTALIGLVLSMGAYIYIRTEKQLDNLSAIVVNHVQK